MMIIISVCLLPAVAVSLIALSSLSTLNGSVVTLNRRSVRPLVALGDLRDMEGDTRVLVWEYLASAGADRTALRKEISDTDAEADQDIAAYLTAHGSRTDSRGRLMADFVTKLQAYRQVRDQQVLAAVDKGQAAAAAAAVAGALDAANEAMAGPLDSAFGQDTTAAARDEQTSEQSYDQARFGLAAVLSLGLLLAGFAAWWLTRTMLAAIRSIRNVMTSGNRADRVGETGDRGELAELGSAIDAMLDSLAGQDADLAREQGQREGHLKSAFVRQQLAEQEVRHRAQQVIDETAATVVQELQDVVAHAEAVLAGGASIDERLLAADQVTRSVVSRARESDRVVAAVAESLKRVGGIAKLIAGVAEQTNLLALNATIEAARAGDAGKGFSVVASEVKGLAAQTARSTSEITVTVDNLESDSSAMATVITEMAEGVKGIDDATAKVSQVASEQRESAERLDLSVRAALDRVRAMAELTDGLERRRRERVTVGGEVLVRVDGQTSNGHLRDISESGMRCGHDPKQVVNIGAKIQIQLHLEGRAEWVSARVVRKTTGEDSEEIGLEIDQDSAPSLSFVRRYIAAIGVLQHVQA